MEKSYKLLIIDDEPPARDLLEAYVSQIPYLNWVGSCSNALQALEQIEVQKPDLLLLDINMPHISGLELLGFNQVRPIHVILTTAYAEHALQSYDFGVTDYLLKPIAFDRFMKAIIKFRTQMSQLEPVMPVFTPIFDAVTDPNKDTHHTSPLDTIWIREEKTVIQIEPADVFYIEGVKDYVKVHLKTKTILTHLTMGKAEEIFKSPLFIRIHRSHIIRHSAIVSIHGNTVTLTNKKELLIGPNYRENLKKIISIL